MVEFGRAGHAHTRFSDRRKDKASLAAPGSDERLRRRTSILEEESIELVETQETRSLCTSGKETAQSRDSAFFSDEYGNAAVKVSYHPPGRLYFEQFCVLRSSELH